MITTPFILDGATGTELAARGMQPSDCTERFILDHPKILQDLQAEYRHAGSDAVLAPTFGANLPTMTRHGFSPEEAESVCRKLVDIAKENSGGTRIGGDMSPTGLLLQPYGDASPESVCDIYRKQAKILLDCGVDFIFIETMLSAAEARLAVRAVRELSSDIPVLVSLTVAENGRTMNGDALDAALLTLIPYHIQGFGCNCSIGPDVIAAALTPAAPVAKYFGIPLIAKPNAGMPITDENGTRFPLSPADMAATVDRLTGLGVGIFGGCCGTTPAHIKAIAEAARSTAKPLFSDVEAIGEGTYVATSRLWAKADPNGEYVEIDGNSEDLVYSLADETDPEEVLYFTLREGAAELLIRMDPYVSNPIAVRGDPEEVEKLNRTLCRKVQ